MHDFDNDIGSFLVALITGNKEYISDETYNSFVKSGIVHIMAVSGLHLSVWVAFLGLFMDFSGRKGKLMAVGMILFTVFMMNFAAFTGSVKRAAAMTILYFIGKIFYRNSDSLNSLGFACICGLVFNPFAALDISFMLSVLSTLGIILMGAPLSEKIMSKLIGAGDTVKRILKPFIVTVCLSISVTLFTLPVCITFLGGFSLVSPITNLLSFVAVTPLLLLTGIYSFIRLVPFVSPAVAVVMKYLAVYILKLTDFSSELPFSYINTDFENLRYWILASFILLITAMVIYNYSRILTKLQAYFFYPSALTVIPLWINV